MSKGYMDPEVRREIIAFTGLCTNPDCTAHDGIVMKIQEYADRRATLLLQGARDRIEMLGQAAGAVSVRVGSSNKYQ